MTSYIDFTIFISGQKHFAEEILRICLAKKIRVVGVCCPLNDKYIGRLANINNIPIVPAGDLNYETMPEGVSLGITAHSFDYIGKKTRYKPVIGWIGYHPSLLPLHRGRSSIEWSLRFGERVTGGTVYWLNAGIDRGDIESQRHIITHTKYLNGDHKKSASALWREELSPLGVEMVISAICRIKSGEIRRTPQNHDIGTYEPSADVKDIFRPDLLMIGDGSNPTKSV